MESFSHSHRSTVVRLSASGLGPLGALFGLAGLLFALYDFVRETAKKLHRFKESHAVYENPTQNPEDQEPKGRRKEL
jgi:hypothetical protein